MNDQQKRYLKLNGDPVHMGPLEQIRNLPKYKAAGLAAAFNLCALGATSPDAMLLTAGGSLLGLVAARKLSDGYDHLLLRRCFGMDHANLAIDKSPDGKTPPTSPRHLTAAAAFRTSSAMMSFITGNKMALIGMIGAFGLTGAFREYGQDVMTPLQLGSAFLGSISSYMGVHFGKAALSHHKVMQQDYAITDMPKPQRQEEKVTNAAPLLS